MLRDLRFALRALRRNPLFALVVVATFALAIAMNTAVFSVANAVLFRALPYPNADRLVWLTNFSRAAGRDIFTANPEYLFWKREARSFDRMAAYGDDDVAFASSGEASQERIAFVTGDFWSTTSAQPALGRLFGKQEPDELVLSWSLYQRRFGGDPHAIGATVSLGGHPFRVVGVLRPDFRFDFPQQYFPGDEVRGMDAYIAIPAGILALPDPLPGTTWLEAQQRLGPSAHAVYVIGQLRPGVSFEQARTEMRGIHDRYTATKPNYGRDEDDLDCSPLSEKLGRAERLPLFTLLAGVGFVLLIACTNIANLHIARAASRQHEAAVRAALGAGKLQLLQQVFVENVLLALIGGATGLVLARICLRFLAGVVLNGGRQLGAIPIDARVLWFSLGLTLLTGLLSSLGPAIPLWRADVHDLLKTSGAGSAGSHRLRGRGILVAAELGMAIVLLAGAGLMLKSFWRLTRMPDGFAPENILAMRIAFSDSHYDSWPSKEAYTEEILRRIRALPRVTSAGVDVGALNTKVHVGNGDEIGAVLRAVSPGYLRAIGVPLLRGDWPVEGNLSGVVVNEAFAREAGGDVLGRVVDGSILDDAIVGIVSNFKTQQLDKDPLPEIYMPYQRFPMIRAMRVLIHTAGPAGIVAQPVREVLTQVDPTQPAYEFETLEQALADSVAPRRFQLFLLAIFASSALLLAMIGIHGVMAWSVAQRTREIGVRMALGARRREIVALVVWQGMRLALIGIGAGLVAAAGLTRLMANLLYDVKPNDAGTFATVAFAVMPYPRDRAAPELHMVTVPI